MKTLANDANEFVSGVVTYLQNEKLGDKTLPKIQSLFEKISASDNRSKKALVETSVDLNTEEKQELQSSLEKMIGHAIKFDYKVKPEILGGLRVVVGDWIIDTSFKKQLEQMSAQLL